MFGHNTFKEGQNIQNIYTGQKNKIIKVKFVKDRYVYELDDSVRFNDDYCYCYKALD